MSGEADKKLYSEDEIAALLKRATELQTTDSVAPVAGLTLAEIKKIAAEAGIDPRYVQAASLDLQGAKPAGRRKHLLGGPTQLEAERVVRGTVTEEQWEAMMQECRRAFGQSGRTERRENTREWVSTGQELEEMRLTVSTRGDRTMLQLARQFDGAAGLYYFVGLLMSFMAVLVMVKKLEWTPLIEWGMALGGLGGIALMLRTLFGRFVGGQQQKHKQLLDRLEAIVEAGETPSAEEGTYLAEGAGVETSATRLTVPDEADYGQQGEAARRKGMNREGV